MQVQKVKVAVRLQQQQARRNKCAVAVVHSRALPGPAVRGITSTNFVLIARNYGSAIFPSTPTFTTYLFYVLQRIADSADFFVTHHNEAVTLSVVGGAVPPAA